MADKSHSSQSPMMQCIWHRRYHGRHRMYKPFARRYLIRKSEQDAAAGFDVEKSQQYPAVHQYNLLQPSPRSSIFKLGCNRAQAERWRTA